MFVSQGENVHETNAAPSVLANTSIDLDQFIVNDESELARALVHVQGRHEQSG